MTAVSLFVRGGTAYLLTDGAWYDTANIITHIGSKVATHNGLRLAVACSGCADPARLMKAVAAGAREFTQDQLLALLPGAVRALREENRRGNPAGEAGRCNEIKIFVAMYSQARRRAEGWACGSDAGYFGTTYRPYSLIDITEARSPAAGGEFMLARDARGIIEAQRAHWCEEEGGYIVGGFGELTTVTVDLVAVDRLVTWPDRVGERIGRGVPDPAGDCDAR